MARTHGHGNPPWTRDETILALDLYLLCEGKVPSPDDKRVIQLSQMLQSLPFHGTGVRKESFRNPAGVGFKLQNLRNVATGEGLGNVSETDRRVWAELGSEPEKVKRIAETIRRIIELPAVQDNSVQDGEEEFLEGRIITRIHKARERNPVVRLRLLAARRKLGQLECEICSANPQQLRATLADAMFEAHHVVPLSKNTLGKSLLNDLALLCANCHRLLHRAIAIERRWIGIDEARSLLRPSG